tara:strand:- start:2042 stop:2179 length:138 start_codon:yes stop_codon:yes gene_type:complete
MGMGTSPVGARGSGAFVKVRYRLIPKATTIPLTALQKTKLVDFIG